MEQIVIWCKYGHAATGFLSTGRQQYWDPGCFCSSGAPAAHVSAAPAFGASCVWTLPRSHPLALSCSLLFLAGDVVAILRDFSLANAQISSRHYSQNIGWGIVRMLLKECLPFTKHSERSKGERPMGNNLTSYAEESWRWCKGQECSLHPRPETYPLKCRFSETSSSILMRLDFSWLGNILNIGLSATLLTLKEVSSSREALRMRNSIIVLKCQFGGVPHQMVDSDLFRNHVNSLYSFKGCMQHKCSQWSKFTSKG